MKERRKESRERKTCDKGRGRRGRNDEGKKKGMMVMKGTAERLTPLKGHCF